MGQCLRHTDRELGRPQVKTQEMRGYGSPLKGSSWHRNIQISLLVFMVEVIKTGLVAFWNLTLFIGKPSGYACDLTETF